METYTLNVAGLQRELPKVQINDELAIASFVMFGDTELIEACAEAIILHTDFPSVKEIDVLCCPEAKAIPLIHAVSRRLDKNYVVARKSVKGYMSNPIMAQMRSITTIGAQMLVLDECDIEKLKDKNICIIDDVVSTGGSLLGLESMVGKFGNIICKATVLLEEAGYDKDDLVYLEKLPIFKL